MISTEDHGDYTNFLIAAGVTPDKQDGRFSELAISNLPLELSRPKFWKDTRANSSKNINVILSSGCRFLEPHSPYNGPLNDEHPLSEIDLDPTAMLPESENIPLRYRLMREWQQAEAVLDRERLPCQFFFGVTADEYRSINNAIWG